MREQQNLQKERMLATRYEPKLRICSVPQLFPVLGNRSAEVDRLPPSFEEVPRVVDSDGSVAFARRMQPARSVYFACVEHIGATSSSASLLPTHAHLQPSRTRMWAQQMTWPIALLP